MQLNTLFWVEIAVSKKALRTSACQGVLQDESELYLVALGSFETLIDAIAIGTNLQDTHQIPPLWA